MTQCKITAQVAAPERSNETDPTVLVAAGNAVVLAAAGQQARIIDLNSGKISTELEGLEETIISASVFEEKVAAW